MQIKFDAHQQFQLDAVEAVCGLFQGQPVANSFSTVDRGNAHGEVFNEIGLANRLVLDAEEILRNVRKVQGRYNLLQTDALEGMNFSVEMETGTGKTYVYLRTVYELNARFGFKKFVIIVPTVAIREGVQKSISMTKEHFGGIYGGIPCDSWVYDSAKVSRLRHFAVSNHLQVLIMNIDSFNKAANVMRKEQDRLSGRRPLEFIQACNAIAIIDEPQNFESEQARSAINSLNPLCTLRYSATHRNPYNLVYRLDPVRAYDLRLVKRIEVDSVIEGANFNRPYVRIHSIQAGKTRVVARIEIDSRSSQGPQRRVVSVNRNGADLFDLSGERELYRGYIVQLIDAANQVVEFSNGVILSCGEILGDHREELMKAQIRETVREHFEKELNVVRKLPVGERLKVLSLFFIDRVANYVPIEGKFRKWFEECYVELADKPRYAALGLPNVDDVHGGCFSQPKGQVRDTSGSTEADDDVYALIMKDKERLLSLQTPLRFIFSHSALREGWDNPNVFQICTLNETKSDLKKRQEIGRGLRLPVNESGERCKDLAINKLTVIANESYEVFARQLQFEIEEECGVRFEGRISNKHERKKANLRKGWRADPDFLALWDRIKLKTRFAVHFSTDELVRNAAAAIAGLPMTARPTIEVRKADLNIDATGVSTMLTSIADESIAAYEEIPDALGYLQRETELTRSTLARILIGSGRLSDLSNNPQAFLYSCLTIIRSVLQQFMVLGIKYEKIAGAEYEMYLFDQQEIESYVNSMIDVKKSIYDCVEFDSEVERRFAEELDARGDIRLFVKLPGWFKIDTPLGSYNPDWAIVKECDGKVYLIRETKGSTQELALRGVELAKVKCGKAHFDVCGVDFRVVISASEV